MEEKKESIKISMSTLFLIFAIVAILIMGVVLYTFYNDKKSAEAEVASLSAQVTEQTAKTEELQQDNNEAIEEKIQNNNNTETNAEGTTTAKASKTYSEIAGVYEGEIASSSNDEPSYFFSLQLNKNGSYEYESGQSAPSGTVGHYIIERDTIVLTPLFATYSDVSLTALKNREYKLTINEDGSITDSSQIVSETTDNKKQSVILKKSNRKLDKAENLNETIRSYVQMEEKDKTNYIDYEK